MQRIAQEADGDGIPSTAPDPQAWGHGQSKTANVLFTVGLDRRGEALGVRAFAVHPGRIVTDLQRFISLKELQKPGFRDEDGQILADQLGLYKTVEQGAATNRLVRHQLRSKAWAGSIARTSISHRLSLPTMKS